MNGTEIIILLVVAGICGAVGQALGGATRGGFIVSIVLGFIGALLGMWMARGMHLPELLNLNIGGAHFPIMWSIIGAAVFMALLNLVSRGSGRYGYR